MDRLTRAPPVTGLALASTVGAALAFIELPSFWAAPLLLLLLLPSPASPSPATVRLGVLLGVAGGCILATAGSRRAEADCRWALVDGGRYSVHGRLVGTPIGGKGEFHPEREGSPPCQKPLRLLFPGFQGPGPAPGTRIGVSGLWRRSPAASPSFPLGIGYLQVDSLLPAPRAQGPARVPPVARIGGWIQARISTLFPATSGLVSALVWARKEGLERELRDSFSRSGVAHLLAISGFHVGVVAGLFLGLASLTGLSHPIRYTGASLGVWAYVLAIGAPDAAVRAGLLLTLITVGRWRRNPVSYTGILATGFLLFLLLDPGAVARPGFQLSFAGAFGLAIGYQPLRRGFSQRLGPRTPSWLSPGLAAGCAATLATLPLVAWHFGRVSLVGIPMTLFLTPIVALAIPGVFTSILLSIVHPELGSLLAGGIELLLALGVAVVRWVGAQPWTWTWVSEGVVLWAVGGGLIALILLLLGIGRVRLKHVGLALVAGAYLGNPLGQALDLGTMEVVMLDVGQGDALLLRSPGGRWVLIDAGPRTSHFDSGDRVIMPYLRRRGIGTLDLLVLTHPDMDHVGGAASVLEAVGARVVVDPGLAAGTDAYLGVLATASQTGVPWLPVVAGDSLNLDGMAIRVLAPPSGHADSMDANEASLVLEVRFGRFSALLTGDAPVESEDRFVGTLLSNGVQLLKVGHHGSATSTGATLLEETRPEVALISVGKRNRFGHPAPVVLDRLRHYGTEILRTDEVGHVEVRVRRDGSYSLRAGRH